ncbi:MAG: 2-amino-4-hydroxy-6-hydroxymethyldihydropteridine diphosphokinase [Thermodesulfobacteriota bacterium]|nr:2-amino-4-hydroxy-6-hydroxymethyldihydropteridine diphosphokinase [Thermodesulfobacteriota bacterium]
MPALKIDTVPSCPVTAFIAFGGNLGSCRETFINARDQLSQRGVVVLVSSPLYITAAVGGPDGQADYLNAVIQVETCLSALQLLELCLEVELEAGRQRNQHWGPRTLDLDLLLYAQLVCDTPRLMLPHPRLHQRRFVLEPLCTLAGAWHHPRLHQSFQYLLQQLPMKPSVNLLELQWEFV